ncbi:MAG: hypothetical protein WC758_06465 [Candidatus Woesearchaeota archaeon]|jgi:predicted Ser/Thr protein kinase
MDKNEALEIYKNKTPFSRGKRGIISLTNYKNKKYCIKEKNPTSDANNRIFLEYENNKKLNMINVGPEIFYYDKEQEFIIRDFVEGDTIFEYLKKHKKDEDIKLKTKTILLNILNQCRRMDKIKMNKLEMTNPHKDILIEEKKEKNKIIVNPIIIDFERCKFTARPKNVTQFCQFLTKGNMELELNKIKITLDKQKIINLAEIYKNNESDDNFYKLREEINTKLT